MTQFCVQNLNTVDGTWDCVFFLNFWGDFSFPKLSHTKILKMKTGTVIFLSPCLRKILKKSLSIISVLIICARYVIVTLYLFCWNYIVTYLLQSTVNTKKLWCTIYCRCSDNIHRITRGHSVGYEGRQITL